MQSQTHITPFGAAEDGNHVCQIADQIGRISRAFSPTSFITQRDASCDCNPLTVG
jgi:hypothetical protein